MQKQKAYFGNSGPWTTYPLPVTVPPLVQAQCRNHPKDFEWALVEAVALSDWLQQFQASHYMVCLSCSSETESDVHADAYAGKFQPFHSASFPS